jgi:zinc-ribbons
MKTLDNGWVFTPDLDISFQHCNRPAYWEGGEVYCSKCQVQLEDEELCDECGIPQRIHDESEGKDA